MIDSHIHTIRGGLNYNLELRWDGVPSLADALRRLREQARRTPAPQWVRVVGGWTEFQFAEKRMPTLEEINAAAPETPVFILYLYGLAMLNGAALRAVGYTKDTPDPPGAEIQRDRNGNPTGLLMAKPNAMLLYATLAKGPKLGYDDQLNSSRHFMRELNRLGLTSVIDAGGGFQNYPDCSLPPTSRIFSSHVPISRWSKMSSNESCGISSRIDGRSACTRPTTSRSRASWDVFERVNRDVPFGDLRWWFDHAETIGPRSLERVRALGGGIAIQDRMAFQGEHFIARYGTEAAAFSPPIRRMRELGLPVGAGTDATRVASYNPWVALYWLITGKTVGGTSMYPEGNRMSRDEALALFTHGSAWFSGEENEKGMIAPGKLADLAVLSADYFRVPDDEIKAIESVLTIVGGRIVHASGGFGSLAPPLPPVSPSWSPVGQFGGYTTVTASSQIAAPVRATDPCVWSRACDCFVF